MSGQLNLTALNASTTVTANKFVGDGSELTGVNTGNTAHGTLPSFSAWLNSASTTVNEGEVIPFNMTSFNNGDHYDASTTFKFTAPTKGQYTFVFSIGDVQSDNSVERIITFYKNGNVYRDAYNNNVNELGDADANAPVLLDLATGDTVDVRMRKGSITLDEGDLGAVNKPTFFGYKVGYGDGAMNVDYVYETLPAFRSHYIQSNPVNFTANSRITLLTEIFDIGSNFDAGVFTAPSAGVYQFGVNFHNSGDSNGSGLTLRINGVNDTDLVEDDSTGYHNWKIEQGSGCIAYLNAGDTVDITSRHALDMPAIDAGSAIYNGIKFWGYKVGYGDGVSIKTFTKSGSVAFYNDGNVGIGTETPAAKLDVTGDIQATSIDVSSIGASLANVVINATYPVGTVIDRVTAITDTHQNGKYKAFLAAPEQEWQLIDNGTNTVVLEYLTQDGTTTSFCDRASLVPATGVQGLVTDFQEITGSAIGNFLPVVGTKKIKYSFSFVNRSLLFNLKFQFKVHNDSNYSGAWQEVSDATFDFHQYSTQPENFTGNISCVFTLDDVDNEDEGRISATRPELSFRIVGREYDATYSSLIHQLNYNFTGDHSASGHATAGGFKPPQITLVSLGPESRTTYHYERTA